MMHQQKNTKSPHFETVEINFTGESIRSCQHTIHDLVSFVCGEIESFDSRIIGQKCSNSAERLIKTDDFQHLIRTSSRDEPKILFRRHSLIFNLYPIHAVVLSDKLILIFSTKTKETDRFVFEAMKGIAESYKSQGFNHNYPEYSFYTVLFQTTVALFEHKLTELRSKVTSGLTQYKKELGVKHSEPQHNTRPLKQEIAFLTTKLSSYRAMLQRILNDDIKLRQLNLTVNQHAGHPLIDEDTNEATNLLESFLLDFSHLSTRLNDLGSEVQRTESMSTFRLNAHEHNLINERVSLKTLLLIISFFTVWMSLFAMNMQNSVYDWYAPRFFWVYISILTVIVTACLRSVLNLMTSWYIRAK